MSPISPEATADLPPRSARASQRPSVRAALLQPAPRPLWFGDSERPLFGWYHAPLAQPRAAIVLCNTFGHEMMVMYRTYRRLAVRLASEGFGVLRFDYDGTGDSAGRDEEPDRVEAWLGSIERAIKEVTALTQTREVVLLGTRLGALLALTQAERTPVSGLVLVAPPRSGKTWLREMRALHAMRLAHQPQTPRTQNDPGIAGFLLSDATQAELAHLESTRIARGPARNVLVVPRDDLPGGEEKLKGALADLGVDVELARAEGYAASMPEDPFKTVVPVAIFDAVSAWLDRIVEPSWLPSPPEPTLAGGAMPVMEPTPETRERAADFRGIFGIVTEPLSPNAHTRTAVLLLNIGANHHIGSNRMYVQMARAWAARGFQVLRMDFSGIGDSPAAPSKENDVYASRFMVEARSGIDFMQAQGATSFVLVGLCSGAYVAYHTAIADPRVTGIALINPLTFHWKEGDSLEVRIRQSFKSNNQYRRELFSLESWARLARGKVGVAAIGAELARRTRRRAERELKSLLAKVTGGIAEATDIERGFRRLCARGTECVLVLGSEDGSVDVVQEHMGRDAASMHGVRGFHLEILDGPDHTFTPLWSQQHLTELIARYLLTASAPP